MLLEESVEWFREGADGVHVIKTQDFKEGSKTI
jgi:hypothetical protein